MILTASTKMMGVQDGQQIVNALATHTGCFKIVNYHVMFVQIMTIIKAII